MSGLNCLLARPSLLSWLFSEFCRLPIKTLLFRRLSINILIYMPREDGAEPSGQENGERLFVIVAVVICFILGTGFCALLFVLNYRGKTDVSTDNLPDSKP